MPQCPRCKANVEDGDQMYWQCHRDLREQDSGNEIGAFIAGVVVTLIVVFAIAKGC